MRVCWKDAKYPFLPSFPHPSHPIDTLNQHCSFKRPYFGPREKTNTLYQELEKPITSKAQGTNSVVAARYTFIEYLHSYQLTNPISFIYGLSATSLDGCAVLHTASYTVAAQESQCTVPFFVSDLCTYSLSIFLEHPPIL